MPVSSYIPHLIYSTALASLSFHLLFQKEQSKMDRAHLAAQTSILEALAHRLRSGQNISDEEVERLCRLAKTHKETHAEEADVKREKVGWKDVFLGKTIERDAEEREKKDLEECEYSASHRNFSRSNYFISSTPTPQWEGFVTSRI
jgi:hypothetical protein